MAMGARRELRRSVYPLQAASNNAPRGSRPVPPGCGQQRKHRTAVLADFICIANSLDECGDLRRILDTPAWLAVFTHGLDAAGHVDRPWPHLTNGCADI